jgi:hypothetical protein
VELAAFIVGSTLVVFVLSAVALVIYTQGTAERADVVVVVAQGSSEMIATGEALGDVPPVWTFNDGDTLTIDNRDTVDHSFGEWTVAPGNSVLISMDVSVDGDQLTTLHPTGVVTVNVEPAGFEFSIIAFTTYAFGISIGIILYVGFSIARAMGRHDDEDWQDA